MSWKLDKNRPICPQICEQICIRIACEQFKANEKLLSVRKVATDAGVNPNTVQKAFEQLEQKGLIYSVRGSGWYVGENIDIAKQTVKELMRTKTALYFEEMELLGNNQTQTKQYVKEWDE